MFPNPRTSTSGPIGLNRDFNKHTTIEERIEAASQAKAFVDKWEEEAVMFVDTLDDNLEGLYEARPWRQYVIEAESGVMVDAIGLTPFNMAAKIAVIKTAVADTPAERPKVRRRSSIKRPVGRSLNQKEEDEDEGGLL